MSVRFRILLGASALAIAIALTGCGSKAPSSGVATVTPSPTTTLTPAQQWSTKVCSAITDWDAQVSRAVNDMTMSLSGEVRIGQVPTVLRDSIGQAANATRQLVAELTAAGSPKTQQGAQIESELTGLATRVTTSISSIREGLANLPTDNLASLATAVGDINSQLNSLVADVAATFARIDALDPGGEIGAAIASTPACKPLLPSTPPIGATPSGGLTQTAPSSGTAGTSATVVSPSAAASR